MDSSLLFKAFSFRLISIFFPLNPMNLNGMNCCLKMSWNGFPNWRMNRCSTGCMKMKNCCRDWNSSGWKMSWAGCSWVNCLTCRDWASCSDDCNWVRCPTCWVSCCSDGYSLVNYCLDGYIPGSLLPACCRMYLSKALCMFFPLKWKVLHKTAAIGSGL